MERGNGIALWRQIADRIRQDIADGQFVSGEKLPPEFTLAERFCVNRHTVRGAIAALVHEGVLRAEQGRGTFVEPLSRISYALGRRTRFSDNLAGQAHETRGRLFASTHERADARLAGALDLKEGAGLVRLDIISDADGHPLSLAVHWFDEGRFPHMAQIYTRTGSITAAFAMQGVSDYLRRSTVISARHAESAALAALRLSPGAIILSAISINEDVDGRAIQFSETQFAADRVELTVG